MPTDEEARTLLLAFKAHRSHVVQLLTSHVFIQSSSHRGYAGAVAAKENDSLSTYSKSLRSNSSLRESKCPCNIVGLLINTIMCYQILLAYIYIV